MMFPRVDVVKPTFWHVEGVTTGSLHCSDSHSRPGHPKVCNALRDIHWISIFSSGIYMGYLHYS